jgi:hypothetical protein
MDYKIKRTRKAQNQFDTLSPSLQVRVAAHFIELERWPTKLSRPIQSADLAVTGMISDFRCGPIDGKFHYIAIFFRYAQDETQLIILAIGHTESPDATS